MRTRIPREVVQGQGYEIHIIGGSRRLGRDLYHAFLRASWPAALGTITGAYLLLNACFACMYLLVGGIAHAEPGSFADAFYFSIQTMGTIGYGTMYPATHAANAVVAAESVTGLIVLALATGLVFARFSQTRARVAFSARAALSPIDGVPTLQLRVGNERRHNNIVEANFRMTLMRTTRTAEGTLVYRTVDLSLVRGWAPALARSWMVLHRIEPGSPLHGETPESLAANEAELTLSVSGVDDTSHQPIHARHTWTAADVVFGARLADVTSDTPDGLFLIDLRRFHELEPAAPAPGFPYPAPAATPMPTQRASTEEAPQADRALPGGGA